MEREQDKGISTEGKKRGEGRTGGEKERKRS